MIDFIESIMCFESLMQAWNIVKNNPIFIVLIIGVSFYYGVHKYHSIEICKVDFETDDGRFRMSIRRSR